MKMLSLWKVEILQTSSTTKAPPDFTWNWNIDAMARLKFVDHIGSLSLNRRWEIVPSGVNAILNGLYGGYISLFWRNCSPELFKVTSSMVSWKKENFE